MVLGSSIYNLRRAHMNVSWLISPFKSILEGVGKYFTDKQTNKHEISMAKHNARVDKIKRGDAAETNYDLLALQNAASSCIDEIMILWTLGIVTLLFIPATTDVAAQGFVALGNAPTWFQLVFVGGFISKLGLRFLFNGRALFGKKVGSTGT